MTRRLEGRADPETTLRYCQSRGAALSPPGGEAFGGAGLRVGGLGFGGYRVDDRAETHAEALRRALLGGVNLIDTSANYADGGSERLIGRVLAELIEAGELARADVVLVTKAGYVQGSNLDQALERQRQGRPFPEIVKIHDDCWHCIHPEFLEDQLERSLRRLSVACVDVFLLHNPEYFLQVARHQGLSADRARAEYERRLAAAFAFLETAARAGRIGHYGVSSNAFPAPADQFDFTSFERCWELAAQNGPDHGFRVLQLPANLFETGAWTEPSQRGGTRTVLELAAELGAGVLLNRPLNAFAGGRLIRLADPPGDAPARRAEITALIDHWVELETKLGGSAEASGPGRLLAGRWPTLTHEPTWLAFLERELIPAARRFLRRPAHESGPAGATLAWQETYVRAVNTAVEAISDHLTSAGRPRLGAVHQALEAVVPPELAAAPLSRKAIWTLRSLPGRPVVLVGMRRPEYVEDCLQAAAVPPGRIDRASSASWVERLSSLV